MPGADMGIDLGTSNTLIYLSGKGVVLNEPSVIAVDSWTDDVVAMGTEAQKMLGRTSERVQVIRPLSKGVISDYGYTQKMMVEYIRRVAYNAMFNPRVVICMPGEITEVERRALVDAARSSGARKVCLLEEPVAAAIGAGMNITEAHGCAVVDIGGGTTDMAVITLNGIASSISIKTAGNALDEEIIKYVRREHKLVIGQRMAEEAKKEIGCVLPMPEKKFFRMKGRSAETGLPAWFDMEAGEMIQVLTPPIMLIIRQIQALLEKTPPELIGDLYDDGILLTGGSSQIYGLADLISEHVKVQARVAENPMECVVRGAGSALEYLDQLRDDRLLSTNPLQEE